MQGQTQTRRQGMQSQRQPPHPKTNAAKPEAATAKHQRPTQNPQENATKGRTGKRHPNRDQAQQKNGTKQKKKHP
jgi:hypothetical protein